jgi:iron complex outermembrane recepter protein
MTDLMDRISMKRAVLLSSVGASLLVTCSAFAQSTAAAKPADEAQESIVVTGSRIARPNLESASPVTVVTFEDIKASGSSKIEDLLNNLPQVFAGQSSSVSNGADGTATVNLRGLGSNRTLVLIDGRRLQPGGLGGGSAADLNFIPSALVSGIEVLTGGASSTYGADAVAGVVNFKMNRQFEGIRADANYSFYQHGNGNDVASVVNTRFVAPTGNNVTGGAFDGTLAIGVSSPDGNGHVVGFAAYREDSAVTQDSRDFSICTLNPDAAGIGFACGGSGTPQFTRLGGFTAANRALAGLPTSAGGFTVTGANAVIPYVALRDAFNFAPLNYYRRPSKRYTAGVFADYEVNEHFTAFLDAQFMDYSTQAQIAPSGAFYGVRSVNCDNPLLAVNLTIGRAACGADLGTAINTSILIGKRNTEGGPRFNDIGYTQFRTVTGVRGAITDALKYEAYVQYGQISVANVYRNDVSDTRIDRALQVVNVGGVPTCKSVVDGSDPSCVPYNVFAAGGVTQAAAGYIGIPLVITGKSKETVYAGFISADFGKYGFQLPTANEGVKAVFGAEYRTEELASQPDLSYINGDGAGQGGPTLPIAGKYSVTDLYTEVVLPLVQDAPFAKELSFEGGFRYSNYKVGINKNSTNTFKLALNYTPIEDIKFRGSYNRAVRSPNIGELFSNSSIGLFAGVDPCVGTSPAATLAQCQRTGVTAAQYGNLAENTAQQYNGFFGGSQLIKPEKATSWTVGVVLTPKSFLEGFTASVDYFDIKVKDAVGTIGAPVILAQCISTGDPFFCSKINRAPASAGPAAGSLWLSESGFVNDRTTNTGSFGTSGVDVNLDYKFDVTDSSSLKFDLVGTYLRTLTSQPITNGFEFDCKGYYGTTCGNSNPEWRHKFRITYDTGFPLKVSLAWRYIAGVKVDGLSPDPDLANPGAAPKIDEKLPAVNYFDLLFSLPVTDKLNLRLGVNNLLDKDPPLISQASLPGTVGNGNVLVGTYDHLGRYVFMNITADF